MGYSTTSLVVAGAGMLIGLAFSGSAVKDLTAPPEPRALMLKEIKYENGAIWQIIKPVGAEAIAATWAAKVMRGDRNICSGVGGSNYDGEPYKGTPSEWTGSTCPEIQPGDRASATWEWRDAEGHIRSASVEFELLPAGRRAGD